MKFREDTVRPATPGSQTVSLSACDVFILRSAVSAQTSPRRPFTRQSLWEVNGVRPDGTVMKPSRSESLPSRGVPGDQDVHRDLQLTRRSSRPLRHLLLTMLVFRP